MRQIAPFVNIKSNYQLHAVKSGLVGIEKLNSFSTDEIGWAKAFSLYNGEKPLPLVWTDTPIPGNFGDWLSPYILTKISKRNVAHIDERDIRKNTHYVGLGSIIGSANNRSIVIGAGISKLQTEINPNARFWSVRGPYTNEIIKKNGGQVANIMGDPGFLLPRIYKPKKLNNRGVVLVRHLNHLNMPLALPKHITEISIKGANPKDIELFIDQINSASLVVTSAMHCFIVCVAYRIPTILFKPKSERIPVPGDGIKYRDATSGVGLPEAIPVEIDLASNIEQQITSITPYAGILNTSNLNELYQLYQRLSNA